MRSINEWYRFLLVRGIITGLELSSIVTLSGKAVVCGCLREYESMMAMLMALYGLQLIFLIFYGSRVHTFELSKMEWMTIKKKNGWTPADHITLAMVGSLFMLLTLFGLLLSGATRLEGPLAIVIGVTMAPVIAAKLEELSYILDSSKLVTCMKEQAIGYNKKDAF